MALLIWMRSPRLTGILVLLSILAVGTYGYAWVCDLEGKIRWCGCLGCDEHTDAVLCQVGDDFSQGATYSDGAIELGSSYDTGLCGISCCDVDGEGVWASIGASSSQVCTLSTYYDDATVIGTSEIGEITDAGCSGGCYCPKLTGVSWNGKVCTVARIGNNVKKIFLTSAQESYYGRSFWSSSDASCVGCDGKIATRIIGTWDEHISGLGETIDRCESACGADPLCDDAAPGSLSPSGASYCDSSCNPYECNSDNACSNEGDYHCSYDSGWKWVDSPPTRIDDDGDGRYEIVCLDNEDNICNSGSICSQITVSSTNYTCVYQNDDYHWVSSGVNIQYDTDGDSHYEVLCNSGEKFVCNDDSPPGGNCGVSETIDSNTYHCTIEGWLTSGDIFDSGGNEALCDDDGEFHSCSANNICERATVGADRYYCTKDSSDHLEWVIDISSQGYGPFGPDNALICVCSTPTLDSSCVDYVCSTGDCSRKTIDNSSYHCIKQTEASNPSWTASTSLEEEDNAVLWDYDALDSKNESLCYYSGTDQGVLAICDAEGTKQEEYVCVMDSLSDYYWGNFGCDAESDWDDITTDENVLSTVCESCNGFWRGTDIDTSQNYYYQKSLSSIIYSNIAAEASCVGNTDDETQSCDAETAGRQFPTTQELTIVSASTTDYRTYQFNSLPTNPSYVHTITCSYASGYWNCDCTTSQSATISSCSITGDYLVIMPSGTYTVFTATTPIESSNGNEIIQSWLLRCASNQQCYLEPASLLPGYNFTSTNGDKNVDVTYSTGSWTCVQGTQTYGWVPNMWPTADDPKITVGEFIPYNDAEFTMGLSEPAWFPHESNVEYDYAPGNCYVVRDLTRITADSQVVGESADYSADLPRNEIKTMCTVDDKIQIPCNIDVQCDWVISADEGSNTVENTIESQLIATFAYQDSPANCIGSTQCLGICNMSIADNVIQIGECTNIGKTLSECELGNYFRARVADYVTSWSEKNNVYDAFCDGHDGSPDVCNSDCEYTCRWTADRSGTFSITGYGITLSAGLMDVSPDCDTYESYSVCKDCCEAPVSTELDASCSMNEYKSITDTKLGEGTATLGFMRNIFCGIPLQSQYDDTSCFVSCGSDLSCSSSEAGDSICTEWCEPRSDYSTNFDFEFFVPGNSEPVPEIDTCELYDACLLIPYDPHCGENGCELTLDSTSHPLYVGNKKLTGGTTTDSFEFTDADTSVIKKSDGYYWKVCQAKGNKIQIIPSYANINRELVFDLEMFNRAGSTYLVNDIQTDLAFSATSDQCGLSEPCMDSDDCFDEGGVSLPFCASNFICADPDNVGAFFQIDLDDSWTDIKSFESGTESDWVCEPGDCSFTAETCTGYFLGIQFTDDADDYLTGVPDTINVIIGTEPQRFDLLTNINSYPHNYSIRVQEAGTAKALLVPLADVIDTAQSGSAIIFVELIDSSLNSVMSSAEISVQTGTNCQSGIQLDQFGSADQTELTGNGGICYQNSSCFAYVNKGTDLDGTLDTVSLCKPIPAVSINGYGDFGEMPWSYAFSGTCTDICGDSSCDEGIAGSELENPGICKDCCDSQYNTGIQTSLVHPEWGRTCYEYCGAAVGCGGNQVGTVALGFVCDHECQKNYDRTMINGVQLTALGAPSNVQSFSCQDTGTIFECTGVVTYDPDGYTLQLNLNSIMWDELVGVPWEDMRNITVRDVSGTSWRTLFNGYNVDTVYTVHIDGMPKGINSLKYEVRQMDYMPKNVSLSLEVYHPITASIAKDKCYYRSGSAGFCSVYPPVITVSAWSDSLETVGGTLGSVDVSCELGQTIASDTLIPNIDQIATGQLVLQTPTTVSVGSHAVECTFTGDYLLETTINSGISFYGRLNSVSAAIPNEVLPAFEYGLDILAVRDELGNLVTGYHYTWYLNTSRGMEIPLATDSPVAPIPVYADVGPAELIIKVTAPFYDQLISSWPTEVIIPSFLGAYFSPTTSYVPTRGATAKLYFVIENDGPTVNVTVEFRTSNADAKISSPVQTVTLSGYEIKMIALPIEIPAGEEGQVFNIYGTVDLESNIIASASSTIILSDTPIYEFDITPISLSLDLIDDETYGTVTIINVGNTADSYLVSSEMVLSDTEMTIDLQQSEDLTIIADRPGNFTLCVSSVKDPNNRKCIEILVEKKVVTPILSLVDQSTELSFGLPASFAVNITTQDYSGPYVFMFDSELEIDEYHRALKEQSSYSLAIQFEPPSSPGIFDIAVIAFPEKYPDKKQEGMFVLDVSFPLPTEVQYLLEDVEEMFDDLSSNRQQLYADQLGDARDFVDQGKFEQAKLILIELNEELAKEQTIGRFKQYAARESMLKQTSFAIGALILMVVGVVIYLK
ncbi:MAG: hypothetical protein GOU99_00465 [Candidatus Altiarchaeota archaeon]|nr:hypothetical protein [Candidatus Altiarchaeota archaeon]